MQVCSLSKLKRHQNAEHVNLLSHFNYLFNVNVNVSILLFRKFISVSFARLFLLCHSTSNAFLSPVHSIPFYYYSCLFIYLRKLLYSPFVLKMKILASGKVFLSFSCFVLMHQKPLRTIWTFFISFHTLSSCMRWVGRARKAIFMKASITGR